jgi:hypothetical protein
MQTRRMLAEQSAGRRRARGASGERVLLSEARLTPETGIETLGSDETMTS